MDEGKKMEKRKHICECLSKISAHSVLTIAHPSCDTKTGVQFVEGVQRRALGLINAGIRPGDIVAIAALNSDLYLQWMLATAYVGAIISPLNYRWSLDEAQSALENLKPSLLVVDDTCASWLQSLPHKPVSVLITANLNKSSASLHYQWAPDGVVLICFTSGTSGKPKGVCIDHTALIVQALAKISIVGYSEDDVYLHTAPLCHIGGISSGLAMLMAGACHVFVPKFESHVVLQAIEKHRVSSLITVPAMMADMISYIKNHSQQTWKGGKYVKKILNGGGQLSVDLIKDAAEAFPEAKLISAYGMTETSSSLTFITLSPAPCKNSDIQSQKIIGACVGKPAPHVELMIDSSDSSSAGGIFTRGPHVMIKYWNRDPVETSSNDPKQGWLDTGDIGYMDGYGDLWLIGRSNDRIKTGGENVYPGEVEAILSCHPGVCGIVVIGVPDTRFSEMVVACLQIKEQWEWVDESCPNTKEVELCSESLYNYCREKKLTGFKIPKVFISWRKPFPVTSTGKVRRDEVRREAISLLHLYPNSKL